MPNESVFDVVDVGTQLGVLRRQSWRIRRARKHRCRRIRADGLELDTWTGNEGDNVRILAHFRIPALT